ncbi:hypothetical protein GJAV_G00076920 [Gymnothorax javanicus]|nr:hypothetical protein GJAV_G00076920 [Gymnothorax javanicus]
MSVGEKTENQEAQEDELLALASIYDQEEFHREGSAHGEVRICPDLPRDFKVHIKAGNKSLEHEVSFLPPLVLKFELPADYPSKSSPLFTLGCKWLSKVQLAAVCRQLDELWQESLGNVVLFSWIQFLREEVLNYLQISSPLELPSEWDRSSTGAHEVGAGQDPLEQPGPEASLQADSDSDLLLQVLDFDTAQRQKAFHSQAFDCGICFMMKLGSDCFCFRECQHVYCLDCTREYFKVLIREGTVKSLKCPQSECSSEATPAEVKELVGEDLFGRYDRLLLQSSLDSMADVTYCPRLTCATAVMVDPSDFSALCSACRYAFCSRCRQAYHGLAPCMGTEPRERREDTSQEPYASLPQKEDGLRGLWEDYDNGSKERKKLLEKRYGKSVLRDRVENALSHNWVENNTKKCPRCSAAIQKNGGCNRMWCSKCHCNFCWSCLHLLNEKGSYHHFSDPAVSCKHFDNRKERELQDLLYVKLRERGLIGEPAPTVAAEPGDLANVPAPIQTPQSQTGMNAEELRLTLRIREVEVRQRELEMQTMHLKVRALELERGFSLSFTVPMRALM